MVETKEFKVVGTRPIRPDGIDKVTGRAQYGADIKLQGTRTRASSASTPAQRRSCRA